MDWFQAIIDGLPIWAVIVLFIVGLGCILKGGDVFVDAASWIAEKTGIPKLIVGATVVSFATTLPELLVSVFATIGGDIGIATGNAIGSVTANLGLILGISIIWIPSVIQRKDYLLKTILMILPLIVMFSFAFNGKSDGYIGIWCAVILFVIFAVNLADNIFGALKKTKLSALPETDDLSAEKKKTKEKIPTKELVKNILMFLVGAVAIVVGAELLVSTATTIAHTLNVSDAVIGLTIVAIGTSLPELVTTITALIKKESSLSVGNVIGANIIDLTMILSICSFISGGQLHLSEQNILLDIPVCCLIGCIALIPTLITKKFRRWQGIVMLAVYIAYIAILSVGVNIIGINPA